MNKIISKFIFIALSAFVLSSNAAAEVSVGAVFSKGEVNIIADWYSDNSSKSTRGKGNGKSKGLPPGIAKNLARGKPLPPGIAKQYLPRGLVDLLPRQPDGFERIILDGKVLLVEIATQVVHDILTDAILH